MSPLLSVALNGSRPSTDQTRVPRTPTELAEQARASVEAGAQVIHQLLSLADAEAFVSAGWRSVAPES